MMEKVGTRERCLGKAEAAVYKYPNSVLATTGEDSQEERFSREQLQKLVNTYPRRMPLNLEHDLSKPSVAYAENLRLEKRGDVHVVLGDITSEKPLDHIPGLSISATSLIHVPELANIQCYLPFPAYRDLRILEMLSAEGDIAIGRLQRKGLTGTAIGLIAAATALVVAPEWDIQYRQWVRPQICKALALISSKLSSHNVGADLCQTLEVPDVGDVLLVLMPNRSSMTLGQDIDAIDGGIGSAIEFIRKHERRDIRRLRSVFYPTRGRYEIINVEYADGSDLNIVP
jgi:hypothetical protein